MERRPAGEIVDDSPMAFVSESREIPTDGASEMHASGAASKTQDSSQKVKAQLDAGINKAASGIETVAGTLREQATNGNGPTEQAGTKIADGMEKTADYLHEHDAAELFSDVRAYVREHPLHAVAGAAVGGFLLSRLLR